MHGHWQRENKRGNVGADLCVCSLCVRPLLERKYFMQSRHMGRPLWRIRLGFFQILLVSCHSFSNGRIKEFFTDTDTFRCDLDEFVIFDPLHR